MLCISDRLKRRRLWRRHSKSWSIINWRFRRSDEIKKEEQVTHEIIDRDKEGVSKYQLWIIPSYDYKPKSTIRRSQKNWRGMKNSVGIKLVFGSWNSRKNKGSREERKCFD